MLGSILIITGVTTVLLWLGWSVLKQILIDFGKYDKFKSWFVFDDKDYTMTSSMDQSEMSAKTRYKATQECSDEWDDYIF